MNIAGLTRLNLEAHTERILRPGWRARPDVRLVRSEDGRPWVVKDYAAGAGLFKRALGAYLTWREVTALDRAQGLVGIPALGGTLGCCALVEEYLDTVEAPSAPPEQLDEGFFVALSALVDELHAKGVVHGDLKKLENILVTPQGRPALVDFTGAFVTGSSPIAALIYPYLADDDRRAVCKLKERCAPDLLSDDEREFLQQRSWPERAWRWSRRYLRFAVKFLSSPEQERKLVRLK
jgi:aminoglycoside phosphotransferase (APT) family kinase protein